MPTCTPTELDGALHWTGELVDFLNKDDKSIGDAGGYVVNAHLAGKYIENLELSLCHVIESASIQVSKLIPGLQKLGGYFFGGGSSASTVAGGASDESKSNSGGGGAGVSPSASSSTASTSWWK